MEGLTPVRHNIEFTCRPARSHALKVLQDNLTVPNDTQADKCNDLLGSVFSNSDFNLVSISITQPLLYSAE